jgi:hypothetical protein
MKIQTRKTMLISRVISAISISLLALTLTARAQSKDSVITEGAKGTVQRPERLRTAAPRTAGHGMLEILAGRWEITASLWLAGPDRAPVTGKGYGGWFTILNDRYLEVRDSVLVGGRPLSMLGYLSWEESLQQLRLSIYSNAGPLAATGGADSAWHDFTFRGSVADRPVRIVRHWINGNHFQLEVFTETAKGREYKLIDADYLRSYGPTGDPGPASK